MEDYYDSSFYFHAGIFQAPLSGVTKMCAASNAPGGTPAPTCDNATRSEFSAYRVHTEAPLWFDGGVRLVARNGDMGGPTPWGGGKCYNLNETAANTASSGAATTEVTAWSWVYLFPED